MTTAEGVPDADEDYLAAAEQAVRSGDGAPALDALGWWDLLPRLDDADSRTAVFALFRAQGRQLASSPALGGLLAQPYLEATATAPGTVVATVVRQSTRRGPAHVVVGDLDGRHLLVDRPGHGVVVVAPDAVELRRLDVPGRQVLHEVDVDWSETQAIIDDSEAAPARARSTSLGRIALGLEILGAAEGAVDLAIEHASHREQFGEPIGRFQAVRHLLAWARTDCVALTSVARQAVALGAAAPPRFDEVVKAIAGRNGRRACERALQVLGGIGFTAEHDHHHHHSRVLALDALLGTSSSLTHALGAWQRTAGTDPGFTTAVLLPGLR